MSHPRFLAIVSTAVASAIAFLAISRSNLVGTVAGAAVASIVYSATSHWAGQGIGWLLRRACRTPSAASERSDVAAKDDGGDDGGGAFDTPHDIRLRVGLGRDRLLWGSVAVALVALGVGSYAVAVTAWGDNPVREVIRSQPVLIERTVVEQAPAYTSDGTIGTSTGAGPGSTAPITDASPDSTTSITSTVTTQPPVDGTTTSIATPPSGDPPPVTTVTIH